MKFPGNIITGHAIVCLHETIEIYSLPNVKSAQAAELTAFTRGCTLEGKTVPIYMNSKYAFGVYYALGTIWKVHGC